MPHRLNEFRAKVQFTTSARMPRLLRLAAEKTGCRSPAGKPSSTVYIQKALAAALAQDLGLDYRTLIEELPSSTTPKTLFGDGPRSRAAK